MIPDMIAKKDKHVYQKIKHKLGCHDRKDAKDDSDNSPHGKGFPVKDRADTFHSYDYQGIDTENNSSLDKT